MLHWDSVAFLLVARASPIATKGQRPSRQRRGGMFVCLTQTTFQLTRTSFHVRWGDAAPWTSRARTSSCLTASRVACRSYCRPRGVWRARWRRWRGPCARTWWCARLRQTCWHCWWTPCGSGASAARTAVCGNGHTPVALFDAVHSPARRHKATGRNHFPHAAQSVAALGGCRRRCWPASGETLRRAGGRWRGGTFAPNRLISARRTHTRVAACNAESLRPATGCAQYCSALT